MQLPLPLINLINGSLLIIALSIDTISLRLRMKKLGVKGGGGGGGGAVFPGASSR